MDSSQGSELGISVDRCIICQDSEHITGRFWRKDVNISTSNFHQFMHTKEKHFSCKYSSTTVRQMDLIKDVITGQVNRTFRNTCSWKCLRWYNSQPI
jgi:hypothetical protein